MQASKNLLFLMAAVASLSAPAGTIIASHPIVAAVRRNDCVDAVRLINPEVSSNDEQTAFLAGRMLDEGVCVQKDRKAASYFLAHAADLGDKAATLDYGATLGLGDGGEQDYERAGTLCRAGGLDPQTKIDTYSLGYACTLSSLAGDLLRSSLPKGAFRPNSGTLLVDFSPTSGAVTIKSMPEVGVADRSTGSNLRSPLISAPQEINRAWHDAVAAAPRPDAGRLKDDTILLPIDVDMTLEIGHEALMRNGTRNFGSLVQGEVKHPY